MNGPSDYAMGDLWERHRADVAVVAASVKGFYDRKKPYRIYHGSTNTTRQSAVRHDQMVDTSGLTRVLEVNTTENYCWVEPNVAMDHLVDATVPHSRIPPVVMEFPGITVGGGFSGTSGESSSFRYGFFDRIVDAIEIVLANGEVVQASKNERRDLLEGAASSFGTLGVITMLKLQLQLIPPKPCVELTYHPISSVAQGVELIEKCTADKTVEYLDGVMFSKDSGVICAGKLAASPSQGSATQKFSRSTDPWFYIHAQERLKKGRTTTELIPLRDYLFRYDRGGFWVGRIAFDYFHVPFNRISRRALNFCVHTRTMYHGLHRSGLADRYIVQDVAVPYAQAPQFAEYLDTTLGIYPLWLAPLKQTGTSASPSSSYGLTPSALETPSDSESDAEARKPVPHAPDFMLNFGVWGAPARTNATPETEETFVAANRDLERRVDSLGGRKWLYARTYYEEEEFWKIYGWDRRQALRVKYHAEHLPTLYDKVSGVKTGNMDGDNQGRDRAQQNSRFANAPRWIWMMWPVRGLYGVLSAIGGGDYLLMKHAKRREVGRGGTGQASKG